jgi:hypothetical protein
MASIPLTAGLADRAQRTLPIIGVKIDGEFAH